MSCKSPVDRAESWFLLLGDSSGNKRDLFLLITPGCALHFPDTILTKSFLSNNLASQFGFHISAVCRQSYSRRGISKRRFGSASSLCLCLEECGSVCVYTCNPSSLVTAELKLVAPDRSGRGAGRGSRLMDVSIGRYFLSGRTENIHTLFRPSCSQVH